MNLEGIFNDLMITESSDRSTVEEMFHHAISGSYGIVQFEISDGRCFDIRYEAEGWSGTYVINEIKSNAA